ncbi:MAG TPA: hypothetical protein VGV15_09510, partial [Terriglobales bacterium]|nr:hypothetical protein [Terriglobales bacterium]
MARRHDQGGRPNFDMVPAASLSAEPGVSDGLLISGLFQIARNPTSQYVDKSALLQVNGLIMPIRAELRSPHFVHALVLGTAEGHGCSKPDVKIA